MFYGCGSVVTMRGFARYVCNGLVCFLVGVRFLCLCGLGSFSFCFVGLGVALVFFGVILDTSSGRIWPKNVPFFFCVFCVVGVCFGFGACFFFDRFVCLVFGFFFARTLCCTNKVDLCAALLFSDSHSRSPEYLC